jgi:hypothetical protein
MSDRLTNLVAAIAQNDDGHVSVGSEITTSRLSGATGARRDHLTVIGESCLA